MQTTTKLVSSPVVVSWCKPDSLIQRTVKGFKQSGVKNELNMTQPCPQISFSGHPWHGAVGQNIFLVYISIKRHSWFFLNHGDVCYILAMFGRRRPVKVDAILFKIVLKCANECLILTYNYVQNPCLYYVKFTMTSTSILLDVLSKARPPN